MKGTRFSPVAIVLTVLLALSAGLGAAQGPAPQRQGSPQALPDTTFTYQGQLQKDGSPINATCVMTFTLYDDAAAGNPVGSPINASIAITAGLFTVPLDFGSFVFTGDSRWLEIAVLCPGDASPNTLAPRQALTAAPYALSLRPGARIYGTMDDGAVVRVRNDSTNVSTIGVQGQSISTLHGTGVFGWASATDGTTIGVWGAANSTGGIGLYGQVNATSGTTYGAYGKAASPAGIGVYGTAPTTGTVGIATATTGSACGVYGQTNTTGGIGVYGRALAANGEGVKGEANRYGVTGVATTTSGPGHGVGGRADSDAGVGIWGYAPSATGATYGVSGQASSTAGHGVYGYANATSGTTYGVHGVSDSTGGRGVAGHATAASGTTYGVLGRADSASGYGVYSIGNFGATGSKAAIVQTPDYGWRHLYSMESPDVLFEDVGTAQLVDGQAVVPLDPIFAQTVNLEQSYQVFLTAQGEAPVLLWVTAKTAASFTVRGVTLDGKAASSSFDYRIIAKRLGYEDVRLAPAADPTQMR